MCLGFALAARARVEFGVVGGWSAHAVNDANIKGIRLCQTLSPFFNDGESDMFFS